jgi:cellulose biosynthesis protein BcsQ
MITIASYNIKGGVGKTATAVNLSYLSARSGAASLLWDLDPQGAASFYFRVKPRVKGRLRNLFRRKGRLEKAIKATDFRRLDLLPADFSYRNMDLRLEEQNKPGAKLRKLLKPLRRQYRYLFLDCPPSISLTSENIFAAADVLLVPVIPTTLSLRTLEQLQDFCNKKKYRHLKIVPFLSMVDRRKKLHCDIVDQPPESLRKMLGTTIPYASEVEQMGLKRAPLETYAHASRAAGAYRDLWGELQSRLGS